MRLSLRSDSPSFADIVQQALLLRTEPSNCKETTLEQEAPPKDYSGPVKARSAGTSPRALGGTVAPLREDKAGSVCTTDSSRGGIVQPKTADRVAREKYFANPHLLTSGESEVNNNRKLLICLALQDLSIVEAMQSESGPAINKTEIEPANHRTLCGRSSPTGALSAFSHWPKC